MTSATTQRPIAAAAGIRWGRIVIGARALETLFDRGDKEAARRRKERFPNTAPARENELERCARQLSVTVRGEERTATLGVVP